MKDYVAKITAVWDSLKEYLVAFVNSFLSDKDGSLITKIQELISNILGTADVVADQVEEAE